MNYIKVSSLVPSHACQGGMLLRRCLTSTASNGKHFWKLELADRDGAAVGGIMFDVDGQQPPPSPSVVELQADVDLFRDAIQLKVRRIRLLAGVDPDDFLPTSRSDRDEMQEALHSFLGSVQDRHLSSLLRLCFSGACFESFCRSPAASLYHQAAVGGLLEHSVNVARICDMLAGLYPELNRDLLVTGALLHDLGKIDAISAAPGFTPTDDGRFLGHIVLAIVRLDALLVQLPDFPAALQQQLYHLIVAHHGRTEYGSPETPKTLEAVALYYADTTEAHLAGFVDHAHRNPPQDCWTVRSLMFETELWVPKLPV